MLDGMGSTFKKLGCDIVAVSREEPEESTFEAKEVTLVTDPNNQFGQKLGLTYVALDEMKSIYEQLGIPGEVEGYFDTSELNVPTTLLLEKGTARILYKFARRDYTVRAPGSEIIRELKAINQEFNP